MAATQTATRTAARMGGRPAENRILDGIDRLAMRLRTATALVGSAPSPFDFGVVRAQGARTVEASVPFSEFTADVARSRIPELVAGTFTPSNIGELLAYLAERMLGLEIRRFGDGRFANYVVDLLSREAVPAAVVHDRLTQSGVANLLGRQVRENVRGLLAEGDKPFGSWEVMAFSSASTFGMREVTARGDELWLGFEHARASSDPAENLRIVERARERGLSLIAPARTRADELAGRFVAGMPIVLVRGSVRSERLDPRLSYGHLSEAFGGSIYEAFEAKARSFGGGNASDRRTAQILDLQAFRRKAATEAGKTPEPAKAGKKPPLRWVVRQSVTNGRERLLVADLQSGREVRFDPAAMGARTLPKEDRYGMPLGFIQVDAAGGYAHLDTDGRPHNDYGPAIVPAAQSGAAAQYAIDGAVITSAQFAALKSDPLRNSLRGSGSGARAEPEPEAGQETRSRLRRPR